MIAGRLLQESGRRQINHATNTPQGEGHSPQTAFTAIRGGIGSRVFRGRGRTTFNGKGRGGFRPRQIEQAVPRAIPNDGRREFGLTGSQVPTGTKCHYCGKSGHWKRECYKRKAEEGTASGINRTKEFTFLVEDSSSPAGSNWIIASGASQHLSRHRSQFSTYKAVSQTQSITIADGTRLQVHGIGDIEIMTKVGAIRLTDVWQVPNIGASLISVGRMVDAGYTVEFGRTTCLISNRGVKTDLGYRNGSLYYLIQESPLPNPESTPGDIANLGLTTNQSSAATLEIWHRRLCHRTLDPPTVQYLASKVSGMEVSKTPETPAKICGICAKGRQHKEPETKARERATQLLEVVHTDICGPMQTPSLHGERYFITFTDELSGRVSICLLHSKDGALAAFEAYRARAEKVSAKEIKAMRSDGGGEYINKRFREYLVKAGIQHRVSPPYSPSQNGLAERMNRTIMEHARCILQDSQLSITFWGPAVLTAAHIHNCLPSRSHDNTSPLAYWTRKEAGIGHLRVFGATAWVHIPKETRRKLDSKSAKCILIGYEEDAGSKLYRLYNPETKAILLSRDVIIDEAQSPPEGIPAHSIKATIGGQVESREEEKPHQQKIFNSMYMTLCSLK